MLAWLLAAAGLGMAVWMARSWPWWSAVWVWLSRWWMVPISVLLLVAAAVLGVLRSRHPVSPPRPIAEPGTEVMPALTPRAILLGALVLLGLGVTAAVLLLVNFSGTEPRDRLDAIRTAATLLVGTGGGAALLLAARRQRAAELSLAVQHKAAADTAHDAAARRITELYLKAVEQLGSDKAAVRHGGLYALERVAQDNPDQRQTVINVICAYLRSPYTPPSERPAASRTGLSAATRRSSESDRVAARTTAVRHIGLRPPTPTVASEQLRQEREVRLTAQRILTAHLCLGPDSTTGQPSNSRYWAEDYDLDLTGATLIDFHAAGLMVRQATFTEVHFSGDARFSGAAFTGDARFSRATFTGRAWFSGATFTRRAWFDDATFTSRAWFSRATFTGDARFNTATFTGDAWFNTAMFTGAALFDGARFADTWFSRATFTGSARFSSATFTRHAWFNDATFTGRAWFSGATFTGGARFKRATFTGGAWFDEATFTGDAWFVEATFASSVVMAGAEAASTQSSVWPTGWTVDDHHQGHAVPRDAPDMLRLVPVPAVLVGPEPSNGCGSDRGGSRPK
ncbi:pentapeptide repeat protein [Lentzea flaviverrucosa]|uniref:Pentapeptide repeat-containing protein n=1 Tax=Lentzea flaviverrucosa TaxID=200379 RepID=A0A1H9XKQ0_9PSEU|nr:pentapeptide repeat protein [Lentzea flaviverrucosa]SES46694.1 Pentapeptide repeat-containing protein [Lentzea flaviverrucosa]